MTYVYLEDRKFKSTVMINNDFFNLVTKQTVIFITLSSKLTLYRTLMACYGAQQSQLGSVAATPSEAIGDIVMKGVGKSLSLLAHLQISSQVEEERCC